MKYIARGLCHLNLIWMNNSKQNQIYPFSILSILHVDVRAKKEVIKSNYKIHFSQESINASCGDPRNIQIILPIGLSPKWYQDPLLNIMEFHVSFPALAMIQFSLHSSSGEVLGQRTVPVDYIREGQYTLNMYILFLFLHCQGICCSIFI